MYFEANLGYSLIISPFFRHSLVVFKMIALVHYQSELPWPILPNSVESDHGSTSRIYFDNTGDKVTLTLYNVALMSWKPC